MDCAGKIARNMGGEAYNAYQNNIKMYQQIMADKKIEKKDKLMYVEMMRKELREKGCYPPRGASSSESSSSETSTDSPDYQCLRISDKVTHSHSMNDPISEERVGYSSPEMHYRRGHSSGGYHKHVGDEIRKGENPMDRMPTHRRNLHRGQHIHKRDIPRGQEDLYILKSQIVPPVCPKCPEIPRNICDKCGKKKSEVEDELINNELEEEKENKKKGGSRAARRREKRRRTNSNNPAQNAPGVMEAANRLSLIHI